MTTPAIARPTDGTFHEGATPEAWRAKRLALLRHGKDFSRARDNLAKRRELLGPRVDRTYTLEEATGAVKLADLFDGLSQFLYRFMLVQIGQRIARGGAFDDRDTEAFVAAPRNSDRTHDHPPPAEHGLVTATA